MRKLWAMMRVAEGQSRYYEAALWSLRFIEARRATDRRFGAEADAKWAAFRGDFGTSARIDLLLRDADAQWPGAFGARSVYDLAAVARDEAFGAAWVPLDDIDAEELWRRIVATPAPSSPATALAQIAKAWGIALAPSAIEAIGATDRLLVTGPSAIAATIDAFARGSDLDWHDQVAIIATPPAHRHLAAVGAAIVNATKSTRLFNHREPAGDLRAARVITSPDASPEDRARVDELKRG
ncbi:MAG: hypothetical protein K8W52_21630 [Deltaproteobacteria bacterium]|nr:hypothetical protein [Deltaproteobacteria bacterium]